MNTILKPINQTIAKTLTLFGIVPPEIHWEHPQDPTHGDYATNIALVVFSQLKDQTTFSNPRALAEAITKEVHQTQIGLNLYKIEVAGPGFINLYLSNQAYLSQLHQILSQKEKYGTNTQLQGKKISVEYTDPNPFKEFHIGHLYSNLIGESVARILEANGATVWRADFYGDVGMHVAKSVWGMMQLMEQEKVTLAKLNQLSIPDRQQFMGRGYAMGSNAYEEDDQSKEAIKDLNYYIYVAGQEALKKKRGWQPIVDYRQFIEGDQSLLEKIQPIYESGLNWSLEYFETVYQRLGTKFDGYYPESWTGELGMQIVDKGINLGVLEKTPEGVVIYRGEQDGLHTRVFVNKLGLPTYEAKDLGLAYAKYQDFPYDLSLNVFGNEIDEYYKVVKSALRKIDPIIGAKASHLAHGMVNLPEGKMTSRSGNVITANGLLDQTKKQAQKLISSSKFASGQLESVAEQVSQAAVKYAFLKNSIGGDIVFDLNSSVSFDGNSGPYLQYSHARCVSVLNKAIAYGVSLEKEVPYPLEVNPEEESLLRFLTRFPEAVQTAGEELAPHRITNYLYSLAQVFNTFYNHHSILGSANKPIDKQTRTLRLMLTSATGQVLKTGLTLLGIPTPDKM